VETRKTLQKKNSPVTIYLLLIFNSIQIILYSPISKINNLPQRALQSVTILHPCLRTSLRIRKNSQDIRVWNLYQARDKSENVLTCATECDRQYVTVLGWISHTLVLGYAGIPLNLKRAEGPMKTSVLVAAMPLRFLRLMIIRILPSAIWCVEWYHRDWIIKSYNCHWQPQCCSDIVIL